MSTKNYKKESLSFFGKLNWANFLDWLITLCLGSIIVLTTVHLGGVRPGTLLAILPLYVLLLSLHGLWLFVGREHPGRLSYVPLWFLPALLWLLFSVLYITPVAWLGWYEWIHAAQAFIVLWVLCNNVATRAHLWALLILSFSPVLVAIFNGFYQFFQEPDWISGALTDFPIVMSEQYLGRATGVFADPFTQAAFLLICLPLLLMAGGASRLPKILRVLCFYIALMVIAGIAFTQVYWAFVFAVVLVGTVPWFCQQRIKKRIVFSAVGALLTALIFIVTVVYHPLFKKGFAQALGEEGEGLRITLWQEALAMAGEAPLGGIGAGAYSLAFEQSPRLALAKTPDNPQNDYLLVLSQFGSIGCLLIAVPVLYLGIQSLQVLRREPFGVRLRNVKGPIMPPRRFFLSLGLSASLAFALCMGTSFLFHVPAMLLYGALLLAILAKASFQKDASKGGSPWLVRGGCFALAVGAGFSFYFFAQPKLQSHSLELRATQKLENLVEIGAHLAGESALLDEVILDYEEALAADPENVDAWVGLSSALCELYFRSPADFSRHGSRAISSAQRAIALNSGHWRAWAQLGVAHAFKAELAEADAALQKALKLAPNSSQAHYYYAAFIGGDSARLEEALGHIKQALEINPENREALKLERKLRIL